MKKRNFSKPDVFVIGLPKSGSTWLYHLLKKHPDVNSFPFFKEPRILCESYLYGHKPFFGRLYLKDRYFALDRIRIKSAFRNLMRQGITKNLKALIWLIRYSVLPRSPRNYSSLFDPSADKISIDVSPIYSRLNEKAVREICQDFPKSKVILLLRKPIDRAWSEMKMAVSNKNKGLAVDEIDFDSYLAYFKTTEHYYLDYQAIVTRWQACFQDRFLLCYYDEIKEAPKALYDKICNFIGIYRAEIDAHHLNKIVNKGIDADMPDQIRKYLIDKYLPYESKMKMILPDQYLDSWFSEITNPERNDKTKEFTKD